jgi:hypothetical protein
MSYRTLVRWAALPVTDRRWAAPLCAVTLGFGLFAGVAIGPGAAGTLATAPFQVIEMPTLAGGSDEGENEADEEPRAASPPESTGGFGGGEESPSFVPAPEEEAFEPLEEGPLEPVEEGSTTRGAAAENEEEPQPEKEELAGTVVHVNHAASSYTVAETGGTMSAVHAGKPPAAGTQVEVPIRSLANGTLAEAGVRHRTGVKKQVTLTGIVTYVSADPGSPTYTVSSRGTSLLIHVPHDASGVVPPLPVLGAYATVNAGLDPAGVLWQQQLTSDGAPFTHSDFEGIVVVVEPETARLAISADDVRESGQDLIFVVPPGIDPAALLVGDSVLASADIAADGTLTLTGLASDERLKGADDAEATQGDLVPATEGKTRLRPSRVPARPFRSR